MNETWNAARRDAEPEIPSRAVDVAADRAATSPPARHRYAPDPDPEWIALDAVAGSEFMDDRIRVRE